MNFIAVATQNGACSVCQLKGGYHTDDMEKDTSIFLYYDGEFFVFHRGELIFCG